MKKVLLSLALLGCAGCSGLNSSSNNSSNNSGGGGNPAPTPAAMAGKWEIISTSTQNAGGSYPYAGIEAILSQTDTSISSSNQATIVIPFVVQGTNYTIASGTACGGYQATVTGTVTGQSLSFTLTETSNTGTYVVTGTATINSNNNAMTGTYTSTGGCGSPADSGTFSGTLIPSVSGTYATTFSSGATATLVVTEDASHNVTATGSYQGSSYTLSGNIIGGGLELSGTIPGIGQVQYLGFYLNSPLISLVPTINGISASSGDFLIFGVTDGTVGIGKKQ
jgi:hypothetical protein